MAEDRLSGMYELGLDLARKRAQQTLSNHELDPAERMAATAMLLLVEERQQISADFEQLAIFVQRVTHVPDDAGPEVTAALDRLTAHFEAVNRLPPWLTVIDPDTLDIPF